MFGGTRHYGSRNRKAHQQSAGAQRCRPSEPSDVVDASERGASNKDGQAKYAPSSVLPVRWRRWLSWQSGSDTVVGGTFSNEASTLSHGSI
jgi:hypothetical protein